MLEKPEGKIKNGQSREAGNIGFSRHRPKTNKTNNITQKLKQGATTSPETGGEVRCPGRASLPLIRYSSCYTYSLKLCLKVAIVL